MLQKELPPLGPSGVLIQIRACGLSPISVERENRDLLRGVCALDAAESGAEYIYLGQDIAGIIRSIGSDVTTLQVGDRVVGMSVCHFAFSEMREH